MKLKRLFAFVLAVLTVVIMPLEISAFETVDPQAEFVVLPEKENELTQLRTRKKVDGLRMYVDEENPLFMIRNCPIYVGDLSAKAFADAAIKTYLALPEDVRNFAVIYIDEGPTYMTPQQQLDFWDELLYITDKENVPIVCQSECFCTNKQRDPFTVEELSGIFERHTSFMGFVQVELSTNGVTNEKLAYDEVTEDNGVNKNILARLKSCVQAC